MRHLYLLSFLMCLNYACIQVPERFEPNSNREEDSNDSDMSAVIDMTMDQSDMLDLNDGRQPDLFSPDLPPHMDMTNMDMIGDPNGRSDMFNTARPVMDDDACAQALGLNRTLCADLVGQRCLPPLAPLETTGELRFNGDARLHGGEVVILEEQSQQVGAVFPPSMAWNVFQNFFLSAQLSIEDGDARTGHGFAMVFQSRSQGGVGSEIKHMGAGFDQNQFVVEFHTIGEAQGQGVSSDAFIRVIGQDGYKQPLLEMPWPKDIQKQGNVYLWLDDYSKCDTMVLWMSNDAQKPATPVWVLNYSLNSHFSSRSEVYVGWSASSTSAADRVRLVQWKMTPTRPND